MSIGYQALNLNIRKFLQFMTLSFSEANLIKAHEQYEMEIMKLLIQAVSTPWMIVKQ